MNDTFMKEKSILPLLTSMALPMVISMLVNSLYNIVDQIFIGQGVGLLGNAATNIAFPITIICNGCPVTGFSGTELCECNCYWIRRRNQRYDRIPSRSWQ